MASSAPILLPGPPPPPAQPLPPAVQRERDEAAREARRRQERAVEKLRFELNAGKLAICVGSGVTMFSVPVAERQRLGWTGLVMNAVHYIEDQAAGIAHENRREIRAARRLLRKQNVTEHDLFDAINRVTTVMKKRADLYPSWLRHAFEGLYDRVENKELLDVLRQLQRIEQNPVPALSLNHLVCENYADIPTWLTRLLDQSDRREGRVHEFSENRQRENISNWLSPVDQSLFLNDILDLEMGPANPFHQEVTGREDFWDLAGNRFFWVTGDKGWGKTVFCSSVINSTRQMCRRISANPPRSRDSLAYFFCTTYDVHERTSTLHQHDFHTFCCTVLEQLCPPRKIHDALRQLYSTCTQYHPDRRPTNAELQDVLITIIDSWDREIVKPGQDNTQPGETYLILDGLDGLSRTYQDPYKPPGPALEPNHLYFRWAYWKLQQLRVIDVHGVIIDAVMDTPFDSDDDVDEDGEAERARKRAKRA
ncbi:hypothetical protein M434DRAFT_15057 [Hypoxylon sp. CO27-5]|nr:hypothetical protein M434DRAFT_15057 [Hypoxylon sp. CO27-5]